MDYWHEIVKSYDDPKMKAPNKKNDGTYSQSSVVILLIYLIFGADHPYHIADYFRKSSIMPLYGEKILYNSNLTTAKVGVLLNRMKEDELVIVTENIINGRRRKTYSINPRILQSPIKSGNLFTRDGLLEIPSETIGGFLSWMALEDEGTTDNKQEEQPQQGRHHTADRIIQTLFQSGPIDYIVFLLFIEAEASTWYRLMKLNDQHPTFYQLIRRYIREIDKNGKAYFRESLIPRNLWM